MYFVFPAPTRIRKLRSMIALSSQVLKAADLVLYSILIEVAIPPILEKDGMYGTENQGLGIQEYYSECEEVYDANLLINCLGIGDSEHMDFREGQLMSLITDCFAELDRYRKLLIIARRIADMHELHEYAR